MGFFLLSVFFYFFISLVIAGLKETYTEAMKRPDVKAIVLTGKFIMDHIYGIALSC